MPSTTGRANYARKNYERIVVVVPKGAKDELKRKAAGAGVSVNRYILEAVEEKSGLKLTLDNALPWIAGADK